MRDRLIEKVFLWFDENERLVRLCLWLEQHGLLLGVLLSLGFHSGAVYSNLSMLQAFSSYDLPTTDLFGMAEDVMDEAQKNKLREIVEARALLRQNTQDLVYYDVVDNEPVSHKVLREVLERFAAKELSRSELHTLQEVAYQIMQNEQFSEVYMSAAEEELLTEVPENIELKDISAGIFTKKADIFQKWWNAFEQSLTTEQKKRITRPERIIILPRIGERTMIDVILAEVYEQTLFLDHRDDHGTVRSWEELYPLMTHELSMNHKLEERTLKEEMEGFAIEKAVNEHLAEKSKEKEEDSTSFFYAKAKAQRRIEIAQFFLSLDNGQEKPLFASCYPDHPITVGTLIKCGLSIEDLARVQWPQENRYTRQIQLARQYLNWQNELKTEDDVRSLLYPTWYNPEISSLDELNLIELTRVRFGSESVMYLLPGFMPPGDRRKISEEKELEEEGTRTYHPEVREQMEACKLPFEQINEFRDEGDSVCTKPYTLNEVKSSNWEELLEATHEALQKLADQPAIPIQSSEGHFDTLTLTPAELEQMENQLNRLDRLRFAEILVQYDSLDARSLWTPNFETFKTQIKSWLQDIPILLTYLEKQRILYYKDWRFFELSEARLRRWLQWQWLIRAYERAQTREEKVYSLAMMASESWPEVLKNMASQGHLAERSTEQIVYSRNQRYLAEVHQLLDQKYGARPRLRPNPESHLLETLSDFDPAMARKIRRSSSFVLPSLARNWISRQDAWPDQIDLLISEFQKFLDPNAPEVTHNIYFLFFTLVARSHHYPSGLTHLSVILNQQYDKKDLHRFYASLRKTLESRMKDLNPKKERWVDKTLYALYGKLLLGEWNFAEAIYQESLERQENRKRKRPHLALLTEFRDIYFNFEDLIQASQSGKIHEMFLPWENQTDGWITMRPFTAVNLRYEQEYYILDAQLLEMRQDLFSVWKDVEAPETKSKAKKSDAPQTLETPEEEEMDATKQAREALLAQARERFEQFLKTSQRKGGDS